MENFKKVYTAPPLTDVTTFGRSPARLLPQLAADQMAGVQIYMEWHCAAEDLRRSA